MKKLILILLFFPIILNAQEVYSTFNHNGINRDYIYYEPVGLPDYAPLVIVAD